MYRCKSCKKQGAQDAHRRTGTRETLWVLWPDKFGQKRFKLVRDSGPAILPCPTCGAELHGTWIGGKKDDSIRCGHSCLNAKGGDCECACGGENHGKQWD